jgi:chromosome segregation protein
MRLNRIKIAGFKSFVDPTSVHLPGNLTGVVGPNGCGKSNIIDAVRWVMGELSARYLRGDSMADVIFNGSGSRKPVGTASVELIFDNADGRVGGAYASYAEISLKRTVERDGTSSYFINGGRCRRRDITQLFLGTGLGSRSYAIIEQGTISRVVEARPEDMRAFIEEAAGISLYKERRRETENRIADTRENLARVSDLREEVDKQIRHLQRQANVARRYQDLKNQERSLTAESLALRLRELDETAAEQAESMRERELAMQQSLAEQRASEAAIEKQREFHTELSATLSQVQARYYEMGAAVTRTEQSLDHARQMRERALQEQAQLGSQLSGIAEQAVRDEQQLAALRAELAALAPEVDARREQDRLASQTQSAEEAQLAAWQERWEVFNRELGAAAQSGEVEAARIEQLENQRLRLQAHADRLRVEADTLATQAADPALDGLQQREASGREIAEQLSGELARALAQVQQLRGAQQAAEGRLERLRREREQTRSELVSLEALQKAALREKNPQTANWLASLGQSTGRRLAEMLEVSPGWERAVETVLGDYLEAVDVTSLEPLQSELPRLTIGQLTFIERGGAAEDGAAGGAEAEDLLAAQVLGPDSALPLLAHVYTAATLAEALQRRAQLAPGESIVTAGGEWLGRGWLRINRGGDVHAGVIEREHRLKELRERCALADRQVFQLEQELVSLRSQVTAAEQDRERTQQRIQQAQRDHAELRARLEALRARLEQAAQRRARLEAEQAEVSADAARTAESLARAQAAYEQASSSLARLDERRRELEEERELRRADTAAARQRAQAAQLELRDAMVRLESRRSSDASMSTALQRLQQRRAELLAQRELVEATLRDGEAPLGELEQQLQEHLAHRLDAESELAGARRALEDCDQQLRALEQRRIGAEQRVEQARAGTEQARLALQESRLRREALLEQFAATHCELPAVLSGLDAQADLAVWEQRLAQLRADIERLGQVNLAAIGELAEQSERKSYLDRQFADVSEALETLETAMRKIDRETRTRFEDTFNRINAGLKQKFPTLFGGGNAYLELVGEDPLAAGVAVMARPPGKRNSTIAQLSGGEKALTAVALVFAIFDLNPAPFCLLDEVDAPLDEHNVGRFCDIVREMSSRIQFIFITHNKVTMELASQLVGVTMSEAGVSRLVTVDIDEAVKLAAV